MWETVDPDGRRVVLTDDRWEHILERHDDLVMHPNDILRAVRTPSRRMLGRRRNEEFFYGEGVGPSRWIKVVVHYERDRGWVVTAFPRRRFP
jgi:hypothetical protein